MTNRYVIDASALIGYLVSDQGPDLHDLVGDGELAVPAICDVEFVGGIARQAQRGLLTEQVATDALVDYVSLPLERHHHLAHVGRWWQLRSNFSAADATYVALAERMDATLVTVDGPLARATRRHTSVPVLP